MADVDSAEPVAKKRSDLPVRVASAAVMVAVAGGAFWLGGWVLTAFIAAIGLGIFAEWTLLVLGFEPRPWVRGLWLSGGIVYIGVACYMALVAADYPNDLVGLVATVIAVDVGAYFVGRSVGGPKIAPAISPSKTWSGLGGAIVGASLAIWLISSRGVDGSIGAWALVLGAPTAIVAQAGDFFESWMKRRAGVKDSGRLIPGHGGFFDRADGLIAVLFVLGLFRLVPAMVNR